MPVDPIAYALPVMILAVVVELGFDVRHRLGRYTIRDTAAAAGLGIGLAIIGLGVKLGALWLYTAIHTHAALSPTLSEAWWSLPLLLVADDLTFYVHHRASHGVRLLWACHVAHHSSQKLNLSTGFRQSWTEVCYKHLWWCWLPWVGFDPVHVLTMMSLSAIYQFFTHTEVIPRLPKPVAWIFNTPSHHRVHHASNLCYLDRNHGGIFIVWDRLFGTFQPELPHEPPAYGLTRNIRSFNPLYITTHGLIDLWRDMRSAPRWRDRLRYALLAPGWRHDGDDQRVARLRAAQAPPSDAPADPSVRAE